MQLPAAAGASYLSTKMGALHDGRGTALCAAEVIYPESASPCEPHRERSAEYSSSFFSSQRVLTRPARYSESVMTVFKKGISVSMPLT